MFETTIYCIQVTPAPSQADVILCSFQHQAWCWDLGIDGASWVSCMTSSTSWPSWFPQHCCFPTEAVWGAEHIEQQGVYHCHIAVSSLCCDFIVSGCRFFFQMCFTLVFNFFLATFSLFPEGLLCSLGVQWWVHSLGMANRFECHEANAAFQLAGLVCQQRLGTGNSHGK